MVAQKAAEQAEIKRIADEAASAERKRTMVALADGFEQAVGGIIGMVVVLRDRAAGHRPDDDGDRDRRPRTSPSTVAAAAEEAAANVNTVAAAAEELGASVQEIGRQVGGSSDLARTAVARGRPDRCSGAELSQAAARDRRRGRPDLQHRQPDQPAGAQRHDRGGARRRGGPRLRGRRHRGQGAGRPDREGNRGDRQPDRPDPGRRPARPSTAIGTIAGRIREINGVAASIAAAVEQQGAATQEIVRNVAQASTGTTEVTSNIAGVAQASEETGAAANEVLSAASELSRQSEHLGSEVDRFLRTVRAA